MLGARDTAVRSLFILTAILKGKIQDTVRGQVNHERLMKQCAN